MGIGVIFLTEIVGAGSSRECDTLGIAMFVAEIVAVRRGRYGRGAAES